MRHPAWWRSQSCRSRAPVRRSARRRPRPRTAGLASASCWVPGKVQPRGSPAREPTSGTISSRYASNSSRSTTSRRIPPRRRTRRVKCTRTSVISASIAHAGAWCSGSSTSKGSSISTWRTSRRSIENIRPGWRARETYIQRGPDAYEEIFELAEAGKPFEVYSHARFTRIR
jgi:hypothetical protein